MKNGFRFALTLIALSNGVAFAQNKPHLVKIVGDLNPVFSVEVNEQDLQRLHDGVKGLQSLSQIEVNINDLYSQKDKKAFEVARQEVSRIMLEATKYLVDMRAILYTLDTELQLAAIESARTRAQNVLQQKFQSRFTQFLTLFMGEYSKNKLYNPKLTEAMEMCFTNRCVTDIFTAQVDLAEFGASLNQRVDIVPYRKWRFAHYTFKSRLVKDAVRATIDEVLKPNKEKPLYGQLLRIAAVPFVAAATGVAAEFQKIADFLNPSSFTLTVEKFYADAIERTKRESDQMRIALENIYADNYGYIVDDKSRGGKRYQPSTEVEEEEEQGPAVSEVSPDSLSLAQVAPLIAAQLKESNQKIEDLVKFNVFDEGTRQATALGVYGECARASEWVSAVGGGYLSAFQSAGITPVDSDISITQSAVSGVPDFNYVRVEGKTIEVLNSSGWQKASTCVVAGDTLDKISKQTTLVGVYATPESIHWLTFFSGLGKDYLLDIESKLSDLINNDRVQSVVKKPTVKLLKLHKN